MPSSSINQCSTLRLLLRTSVGATQKPLVGHVFSRALDGQWGLFPQARKRQPVKQLILRGKRSHPWKAPESDRSRRTCSCWGLLDCLRFGGPAELRRDPLSRPIMAKLPAWLSTSARCCWRARSAMLGIAALRESSRGVEASRPR